ncbi:MAG: ORF6N domain-containing protein [Ruminococcus sp.]|nr:ORF6N domain-containing protein [Ruminococcus sp.]
MEKFNPTPIEKNEQRVLTTAQLAEAYGTDSRRISENFNRNREHFIEGKHFYCLTGKALKEFRANTQFAYSPKNIHTLYLWTEKGALLHAKSLNTEKAWEVYDFLVDNYFRTRKMITSNNDALIIEKLELLEQKINSLDNKVNILENKSDNIIKTLFDMSSSVFAKGLEFIYNNFFK